MRILTYLLFLIVLTIACNTEPPAEKELQIGQWHQLFNGKDLSGWEKMGDFDTEIKNQELHLLSKQDGGSSLLLTQQDFDNFSFEAEFLLDSTVNSGIFIRYDNRLKGMPNKVAYEANLDWNKDRQNTMGTLEFAQRATAAPNVNKDDWNTIRIEADGDLLAIYLNDARVAQTHNRRASNGKVALQVPINQGDRVAFRNIKIKPAPPTTELKPLVEEVYRNSNKPMNPLVKNASLDNFYTKGPGTWKVEGEVLHGYSGDQHSFLCTNDAYQNFYLKCQFKIKKEDNSGIFIRKHPDSIGVTATDAIECNIYDHNGFTHAYSTGSIVFHAAAWSNMIDYEDWNEMEIFAENEHIVLFVNGQKSAEAYLPPSSNKPGHICLQAGTRVFSDNGPSDIYFKELMVKSLD